jgi:hypothetical protein
MKDEFYTEFKYPRGINSRSDLFKCHVGPVFQAISDVLFQRPEFIKKIPVADRPSYIMNYLKPDGKRILATDFTSFEAQFTEEIMKCEISLYKHMTSHLTNKSELWNTFDGVLAGKNTCAYRNLTVKLKATRMSGEMCTSLGNGFSNLMFNLFMLKEHGVELDQVRIVVEGDDALITIPSRYSDFSGKEYEKLGLVIKLLNVEKLSEASFCGLIFDPIDLINVTDPLKVIATFGWAQAKYSMARATKLLGLMRCKSLSLIHQYPGCPIIQALGLYGLRHTRGIDTRKVEPDSWWEREKRSMWTRDLPVREPGMRTRLLVEEKYGISVENQIRTEKFFETAPLGAFDLPWLSGSVDSSWTSYSARYTCRTSSWRAEGWLPIFGYGNHFLPLWMSH